MQFRAPWLQARMPLIASAGWDAFVVPLSYGCVYRWHHGNWPQGGFALPLYLGLWLAWSYLLGRYSKTSEHSRITPNRSTLVLTNALSGSEVLSALIQFQIQVFLGVGRSNSYPRAAQTRVEVTHQFWFVLTNGPRA